MNWGFYEVWRYREALWNGLVVTFELNFVVLLLGTVLGGAVGVLRLSRWAWVRAMARAYVDLFRSFPALVLLVWLFFALPLIPGLQIRLTPFICAAAGLALNLSAFVAEIVRAGVLAVPRHHIDSAKVMGFSPWQVWRHVTGPIALRIMLAPLFGQYINQVKLSVLASVIAVPELLHTINTITTETFRPLELYTTLALIFLAVLIPCTCLQGYLESVFSRQGSQRANGNLKTPIPVSEAVNGVSEIEIPRIDVWPRLPQGACLVLDGVACGYNGTALLDGVGFKARAGTVTAIIGPNGSVKTTLVKSIMGLLPLIDGTVRLEDGQMLATLRLGYMAQEHEPFPHLSVEDNLVMPLTVVAGLSRHEARTAAAEWLRAFKLDEYANVKPATLSGGQRQRLVLARTLCLQPQAVFLDEPTSAMDFRWALVVNKLVRKLADAGLIVLAISHGVGFVRTVADDIVFLDRGGVAEAGNASILAKPQTEGLKSFLEAA
jgi:polar amino acid transport system permease protein